MQWSTCAHCVWRAVLALVLKLTKVGNSIAKVFAAIFLRCWQGQLVTIMLVHIEAALCGPENMYEVYGTSVSLR